MQALDWTILQKIQEIFRCDLLDGFFNKFTLLGEAGIIWIIIILALLFTRRYRKLGILCIIGLILELIIGNGILKNLIQRPRPIADVNHSMAVKYFGADFVWPYKLSVWDSSFPSGHAFSSFIVATLICIRDWKLGIPAMLLAILMGFSRLYLCLHFPSDVFAGMIFGITVAIIIWMVNKRVEMKKEINK